LLLLVEDVDRHVLRRLQEQWASLTLKRRVKNIKINK